MQVVAEVVANRLEEIQCAVLWREHVVVGNSIMFSGRVDAQSFTGIAAQVLFKRILLTGYDSPETASTRIPNAGCS